MDANDVGPVERGVAGSENSGEPMISGRQKEIPKLEAATAGASVHTSAAALPCGLSAAASLGRPKGFLCEGCRDQPPGLSAPSAGGAALGSTTSLFHFLLFPFPLA